VSSYGKEQTFLTAASQPVR